MKRRIGFLCLPLVLCIVLGCSSREARETPLAIGETLPNIRIVHRVEAEDGRQLGLPSRRSFRFQDIDADLIVLEVMNVNCSGCRTETSTMVEVHRRIETDSTLSGRVKVVALAAGNPEREIGPFKKLFAVEYPIIPDAELKTADRLGAFEVPYHLVLRRLGDELVVVEGFAGVVDDAVDYLENLRGLLDIDPSGLSAPKQDRVSQSFPQAELPISEDELLVLMTERLAKRGWRVMGSEKVQLGAHGSVYLVEAAEDGTARVLFARTESRKPVCTTCEDGHFMYLFDIEGRIVHFVPIQLSKDQNKPWDEHDVRAIEQRLLGRSVRESFAFDPQVDAVTSATVTSELIFMGLQKAAGIYAELKRRGRLN